MDRCLTARQHRVAEASESIGKEANRWQEQFYLGADEEAQVECGTNPASVERLRGTVLRTVQTFGRRRLAKAVGLSLRDVGAWVRTGAVTAAAIGGACRAAA